MAAPLVKKVGAKLRTVSETFVKTTSDGEAPEMLILLLFENPTVLATVMNDCTPVPRGAINVVVAGGVLEDMVVGVQVQVKLPPKMGILTISLGMDLE